MTELLHFMTDERVDCDSILVELSVGKFIEIADNAYRDKGGIEGQRPALKTKTARIIRSRLVDDLKNGAIVPPIVIGALVDRSTRNRFNSSKSSAEIISLLESIKNSNISIIDGMQRTTAFIEASAADQSIKDRKLRVELWVSERVGSLVYRMLVLNTGQVPWEVSRQLETVYSQIIEGVKEKTTEDIELYLKDEGQRRKSAGQYQASTIVRLYLAFSARRAEFDIKDRVAEDFARIDAIEASSHSEFLDYFVSAFELLVRLDRAFSRSERLDFDEDQRITEGKKLFQAEPALIGFFVAVAIYLFDEPGFDVDWSTVSSKMDNLKKTVGDLCERLNTEGPADVTEFLQLDVLNQRLKQRSGQVGRFERDLFVRAFGFLLERAADLKDMQPAWVR